MSIDLVERFFMWCTILNGSALVFSSLLCICATDRIYSIHKILFNVSRDSFNNLLELFIGIYKIVFLTFNLFPYIALLLLRT